MFKSTIKAMQAPPKGEKKLSKIIGTNWMIPSIHSLSSEEIYYFRLGTILLAVITGGIGYYCYKQNYRMKMQASQSYYKLTSAPEIDAGKQFFYHQNGEKRPWSPSLYWRMPLKEFNILYRMRSAYIDGEFDHKKEVLIPKKKNGVEGYDVITPFYYYEYARPYTNHYALTSDGKVAKDFNFDKAGIAVHRGWYFFIFLF